METSPTIKALAAALLAFQKAAPKVHKNAINPAFKSKYADLATILDTISDPLKANDLVVIQFPDGDGLTTRLQHESGEYMQATAKLCVVQQTPQAMGSATTYARRYALCALLSLVVEDDDGQAASAAPAYSGQQLRGWAEQMDGATSKAGLRKIWDALPAEVQPIFKQRSIDAATRIDDAALQAADAPASDKQKNELRQLLSADELQGGSGVLITLAKLHQLTAPQADNLLAYYKQALQDVLDSTTA